MDGIPRLQRTFRFRDFGGALNFATELGRSADAEGHHPRITWSGGALALTGGRTRFADCIATTSSWLRRPMLCTPMPQQRASNSIAEL
ncbi:Putative pterin-4-alpha-carbinolamine dehydratase [Geodia barretti]|uniref:4a-hydroxytetrahydrobiopterin dehydratase n=1 Tax=Geodia barretti TaxID=519541 RepID=A0AA35RFT8_GEOBA|nr:Putative pterin-4-alpha-carbinolamine dehydratase [Geodia barretti]